MNDTPRSNPLELRKALGIASGTKKKRGRPVKPKDPLPGIEDLSISDTFATDTGLSVIPESPPLLSTSVSDTPPSSKLSTDWQVTLIGYAENGLPMITDEQWEELPLDWRERLQLLADGRDNSPQDVLADIVEYYMVQEGDQCEWPLVDALGCYLANEVLV